MVEMPGVNGGYLGGPDGSYRHNTASGARTYRGQSTNGVVRADRSSAVPSDRKEET